MRSYANIAPASLTTDWLEKQAKIWADDALRVQAASRMYRQRFNLDVPDGTTLAQLRGMEGQRIKALYRLLAQKHRITRFKRNYDPAQWDSQDPVNLALSAANTCLYGVVHAAVCALGCSPALGFVHSGTQLAFVYDIADLHKARITIPLAFALHATTDPERAARTRLRDDFRLVRLLPTIVTDIQNLLDLDTEDVREDPSMDMVHLWDPELGQVPAGVNYGDGDTPTAPGDTDDDDIIINLGGPWPQ